MSFHRPISVSRSQPLAPPKRLQRDRVSHDARATMRNEVVMPVAIIGGLLMLMMTLGMQFAVDAFDRQSRLHEQTLVRNGIERRVAEVAQMVVPQANWDDAVRHLDNAYDPAWAVSNIGSYLSATDGFDSSFVLAPDGRVMFAAVRGNVTDPAAFDGVRGLSASLIRAVRDAEAKRGPFARAPSKKMISTAIQSSALKLVGGKLVIMTATLVQPDFGTAFPSGAQAPVIVTTMPVDDAFLSLFAHRFLLDDLRVRSLDAGPQPGEAEIAARDEAGRTLAWFAWRPAKPGYAMLRQMVMPILIAGIVLIALAAFQLRRIYRFARHLLDSEATDAYLATHDHATGLPNRQQFDAHLAMQLAQILDGDHVLTLHYVRLPEMWGLGIADGIAARDAFLNAIARKLKSLCRADSLAFSLSDEEMAILALTGSEGEAIKLGERLRGGLAAIRLPGDDAAPLPFQFGTASTDTVVDQDTLLWRAMHAAAQG